MWKWILLRAARGTWKKANSSLAKAMFESFPAGFIRRGMRVRFFGLALVALGFDPLCMGPRVLERVSQETLQHIPGKCQDLPSSLNSILYTVTRTFELNASAQESGPTNAESSAYCRGAWLPYSYITS